MYLLYCVCVSSKDRWLTRLTRLTRLSLSLSLSLFLSLSLSLYVLVILCVCYMRVLRIGGPGPKWPSLKANEHFCFLQEFISSRKFSKIEKVVINLF